MAGTWKPLVNQPTFNTDTVLLLTDGSVFCHEESSKNWHRFTPDAAGNYETGTWSSAAPLPDNPIIPASVGGPTNAPLYFASAVLRDGTVFVAGGEYNANIANADILATQVYDPVSDSWKIVAPPAGWTAIGDAPSCVLADGRLLLGSILTKATAIFDPVTRTFSPGPDKDDTSSEETWTLLPDGTVLTAECTNHPKAEKFVPGPMPAWVSAGSTPSDLVESSSIEIGPAILLPDGRVFAIGATGHTGLYTRQPAAAAPGSWVDGPTFPVQAGQQLIAKDAPAVLLPNGRVLCAAGPAGGCAASQGGYCPPTFFFEFDGASTLTSVPAPPNAGGAPYTGRMLLLPSGKVLYANGTTDVEVYTPDGAPNPAWAPRISACATTLQAGQTYTLTGTQLNGLSQAVSYGDDAQMATNYPLVRIRNLGSNRVRYCRTHDHSTMGVATGGASQTTRFTVPAGIEEGHSDLTVVANGIPSIPLTVTVVSSAPARAT